MIRYFAIPLLFAIALNPRNNPILTYWDKEKSVDVYIHIDTVSDQTRSEAEEFLNNVSRRLAQADLNVNFTYVDTTHASNTVDAAANISFAPLFNGTKVIIDYTAEITANPQSLYDLSPVLENNVPVSVKLSSPTAIDTIYSLILLVANRCDLAIPILESFKISDRDAADRINYNLATCYLLQRKYQQSIDLYKHLLYIQSPRFLGVNLAWLYVKTGQENAAFDLMSTAIETAKIMDEAAENLLASRAQLYNLVFRYDDAITDLDSAIELSPNDPALYTIRGQTYILLYQWDNVLADYNKALKLDPTFADAYFYRGVLKYSVLQTGASLYPEALADFQKYLDLVPLGEHAADATRYATDIQTQLAALNN